MDNVLHLMSYNNVLHDMMTKMRIAIPMTTPSYELKIMGCSWKLRKWMRFLSNYSFNIINNDVLVRPKPDWRLSWLQYEIAILFWQFQQEITVIVLFFFPVSVEELDGESRRRWSVVLDTDIAGLGALIHFGRVVVLSQLCISLRGKLQSGLRIRSRREASGQKWERTETGSW